MAEFVTPDFLKNRSENDFFERIKSILPDDLDLSEGGHAYNLTMPIALVAAEICEFILPEAIRLIYPEYSYDEYLDNHAKTRGMIRRAATAASGELTITGTENAVIPAGSLFSTIAVGGEPSRSYETLESVTIPEEGSVKVKIQCTDTGIVGNTTANTIVIQSNNLIGITSVTNEAAVGGGTEEETDESLQQRILEYDQSQGDSFTGSAADYKRWGTSVAGVGDVTVISATDDTGLVRLIVTDANGDPATEELCTEVYNYIMRPDDPGVRLAPINAMLSVEPPATIEIGIQATIELEEEATIESVKSAFIESLTKYLPEALEDREVKYTRIGAILSGTAGVNDFSNLQIGAKSGDEITYSTANIQITSSQLPTIDAKDLVLSSGTV